MKSILRSFFALTISVNLLSCGGSESPDSDPTGKGWDDQEIESSSASTDWRKAETISIPRASSEREVKLAAFFDRSGSMAGFETAIGALSGWIRRSTGQFQAFGYRTADSSRCDFNATDGVSCGPLGGAGLPASRGNTNLDSAIAAAEEYDAAIIVTDGVAAAGSRGSQFCADGVDAKCVGERLAHYVNSPRDQATTEPRAALMMAVRVIFSGTFYTERSLPHSQFDLRGTVQRYRDAHTEVTIRDPRNIASGELVYHYQGPRALLLVVLARDPGVARALVAALQETAQMEALLAREPIQSWELFPGYSEPTWEWLAIEQGEGAIPSGGTLRGVEVSNEGSLEIACGEGKSNPPVSWLLNARAGSAAVGVSNAQVKQVPLAHIVLVEESAAVDIQTLTQVDGDTYAIRMNVWCAEPAGRLTAGITWSYSPEVSNEFAELSTLQPEREPDRVFALAELVQTFYQSLKAGQRMQPVAELTIEVIE